MVGWGDESHNLRTVGDIVEHLESIAADLVDGTLSAPTNWTATNAVLATIASTIRPRLQQSGSAELAALIDGLDGKFIRPGPSGAPSRGRRRSVRLNPSLPARVAYDLLSLMPRKFAQGRGVADTAHKY